MHPLLVMLGVWLSYSWILGSRVAYRDMPSYQLEEAKEEGSVQLSSPDDFSRDLRALAVSEDDEDDFIDSSIKKLMTTSRKIKDYMFSKPTQRRMALSRAMDTNATDKSSNMADPDYNNTWAQRSGGHPQEPDLAYTGPPLQGWWYWVQKSNCCPDVFRYWPNMSEQAPWRWWPQGFSPPKWFVNPAWPSYWWWRPGHTFIFEQFYTSEIGEDFRWYWMGTCYVEFEVYVNQTNAEIHLVLTNDTSLQQPYYMICIGCLDGTMTYIRRNDPKKWTEDGDVPMRIEQRVEDPSVVRSEQWNYLWLHCTQEGYISVGKRPPWWTVVMYVDHFEPLPIKYMGVTSAKGFSAYWDLKVRVYNPYDRTWRPEVLEQPQYIPYTPKQTTTAPPDTTSTRYTFPAFVTFVSAVLFGFTALGCVCAAVYSVANRYSGEDYARQGRLGQPLHLSGERYS